MAENINFEDMLNENVNYEDFLLLLLAVEDIDNDEHLLLMAESKHLFQQSNFPFQGYEKFDWNSLDELFCKTDLDSRKKIFQ